MSSNPHGLVLPPELNPRGKVGRPHLVRRVARILSWTAVVTSVVVLVASTGGFLFVRYLDRNITRIPGLFRNEKERPTAAGSSQNFLLVGSDTREGATPEELAKSATTFEPGRRSDTVILIHLSAKQDKALLLSFPRDAYVDIPGVGKRKLNTAFSQGGPALTISTIEALTQVRVDHYLEVNFTGFFRMVEALGGVDVCLPKAQKERLSGIDLPAGRSRVQGEQALAFVRQRHGLPRGDIDRIERQQQFLGAMLRRSTSKRILLRPDRLRGFLQVVTDSIQVDEKLSFNILKDLAFRLKDLDPQKVQFMTVPVDKLAKRGGASVVLLDEPATAELFTKIRTDTVFPDADAKPATKPSAPPALTVAPSSIRVDVLNGTSTKGFAGEAADALRGLRFGIGQVANADLSTYDATEVRYGPGRLEAARTVAAAIPGAKLVPVDSLGRTVVVVVGANYTGVQPVKVTATGRPGSAPPTAAPKTAADDPCAA